MQPEIVAAIIAALVSVIATLVTLFIGLRSLRNEREKIRIETDGLRLEKEKAQADLRESARQARVWQEDIDRLRAETRKLIAETDEIHLNRLKADRKEIKDFLVIFNRAAFYAPFNSEDPVKLYRALRETRIKLQTSGANLIRDEIAASNFAEIRQVLFIVEAEVIKHYPVIAELDIEEDEIKLRDRSYCDLEKRRRAEEKMQGDYYAPVRLMLSARPRIENCLDNIQARLHELDNKIEGLMS